MTMTSSNDSSQFASGKWHLNGPWVYELLLEHLALNLPATTHSKNEWSPLTRKEADEETPYLRLGGTNKRKLKFKPRLPALR